MAIEEVLQIYHAEEPAGETGISIQEQGAVMFIHVVFQLVCCAV